MLSSIGFNLPSPCKVVKSGLCMSDGSNVRKLHIWMSMFFFWGGENFERTPSKKYPISNGAYGDVREM